MEVSPEDYDEIIKAVKDTDSNDPDVQRELIEAFKRWTKKQ